HQGSKPVVKVVCVDGHAQSTIKEHFSSFPSSGQNQVTVHISYNTGSPVNQSYAFTGSSFDLPNNNKDGSSTFTAPTGATSGAVFYDWAVDGGGHTETT